MYSYEELVTYLPTASIEVGTCVQFADGYCFNHCCLSDELTYDLGFKLNIVTYDATYVKKRVTKE